MFNSSKSMQMDIHAVLKVYSFSSSSLFFMLNVYIYIMLIVILILCYAEKSNALSFDLFEIVEK